METEILVSGKLGHIFTEIESFVKKLCVPEKAQHAVNERVEQ